MRSENGIRIGKKVKFLNNCQAKSYCGLPQESAGTCGATQGDTYKQHFVYGCSEFKVSLGSRLIPPGVKGHED